MKYQALIEKLWQQYSTDIGAARRIHQLFLEAGETVVNDHIALRTFDDPRVDIDVLAEPFVKEGYVEKGQYDFPNKKLFAKHYEHARDVDAPKVFISELMTHHFSDWLQDTVAELLDAIPTKIQEHEDQLICCGTPWAPLSYSVYERLLKESQYAAWMYAFGYRANHFTVSVNHLTHYDSIEKVNAFLKKNGFVLNAENGEIKGTPAECLEQSSTMAERQSVSFLEGQFEIPTCYYEFAKRYKNADGELYQGFVSASADKIFESTHNKPK